MYPADLVTFTGEIRNWKLHLLCSASPSFFKIFIPFLMYDSDIKVGYAKMTLIIIVQVLMCEMT